MRPRPHARVVLRILHARLAGVVTRASPLFPPDDASSTEGLTDDAASLPGSLRSLAPHSLMMNSLRTWGVGVLCTFSGALLVLVPIWLGVLQAVSWGMDTLAVFATLIFPSIPIFAMLLVLLRATTGGESSAAPNRSLNVGTDFDRDARLLVVLLGLLLPIGMLPLWILYHGPASVAS